MLSRNRLGSQALDPGEGAVGRIPALSRVADTAARKPLKRLTFARSARNTPLKQGVHEIWGEADKAGMLPVAPGKAGVTSAAAARSWGLQLA